MASRFADAADEEGDEDARLRKLTLQEKAVYLEGDALQIEMGNIVMRTGVGGNVLYDVARATQHKDRYSALAMAVRYIAELEDERKRRLMLNRRRKMQKLLKRKPKKLSPMLLHRLPSSWQRLLLHRMAIPSHSTAIFSPAIGSISQKQICITGIRP